MWYKLPIARKKPAFWEKKSQFIYFCGGNKLPYEWVTVRERSRNVNVHAYKHVVLHVNVFEWECARTLLFDHYIMHLGSVWRKYLFCTMDTFKFTWSEMVLNVPYKHTITTWCYCKMNKHYRIRAMNFNNRQSRSMHRERPNSAWSKEFYPAQLYCRLSSRSPLPCLCFGLCWLSPLNCCLCSSPP